MYLSPWTLCIWTEKATMNDCSLGDFYIFKTLVSCRVKSKEICTVALVYLIKLKYCWFSSTDFLVTLYLAADCIAPVSSLIIIKIKTFSMFHDFFRV